MTLPIYALTLAIFAQGCSEFMFAGLITEVGDDFGVSLAAAGTLTSAFAVGIIVGAPLMALISGRWPGAGRSCCSCRSLSQRTSWARRPRAFRCC
ncbi:putative chloramphenicol resistance protein [Mycobacteroides abscessus MAB_030201_1075]|uniref:Putative chloramphenicol resistance protein n=1 Tax=Mycobacteroides abscessus MAB_030201_1075 TaxID=1335410 RepID=A0A829PS01_9MYCO|nr:putative chloramphenicol resistance protein [Mycobacteroides abscessus MAB_030201_1075]